MKSFALALSLLALPSLLAADLTSAGNWKVSFDEPSGSLVLENAVRKVRLEGQGAGRARGQGFRSEVRHRRSEARLHAEIGGGRA